MAIARLARIVLGTVLVAASLPSRAEFSFDAKLGWDGRVRNGRWNPVLVQLQNATTISVDIELYTPRDSSQAVLTRRAAIAGPVPQFYAVYAPLAVGPDATTLKIVEASTRKTLGETKLVDDRLSTFGNTGQFGGDLYVFRNGLFVGVSGIEPALKELGAFGSGNDPRETVGYLKPFALPQAAKGYDALDVLVLNQPDLNTLAADQKRAMLDWVRSGGRLLVWFGAGSLAPDDPITLALPCKVGDNTTLELASQDLRRAGLPDRFQKLGGRVLVPRPGAKAVNVLGGGGAKAVYARYGFGQIAVLSFDGSTLSFRDNRNAREFWEPLLQIGNHNPADLSSTSSSQTADEYGQATSHAMDLLGSVPGVGTFGFGYVAATLIALMLIVGPVDWLVLKWIGRQPWTWVTTAGWIGLITVVAIYMGHLLRSGNLHLRTLRVVDQVDGVVVARNDFVGIYSPRTAEYELEPPPGSWWEPLSGERYYYSSDHVVTVLDCRQNLHEAVPDPKNPMTIPVWNLRFLRGETIEKGEPLVAAALEIRPEAGGTKNGNMTGLRVVGTITNLGETAIGQVSIQARGGAVYLDDERDGVTGGAPAGIPPHGTRSIDLPLRYDSRGPHDWGSVRASEHPDPDVEVPVVPSQILRLAETLAPDRTRRVTEILSQRYATPLKGEEEMACVSVLFERTPAAVKLKGSQPIEKNWLAVRALVKLKRAEEK